MSSPFCAATVESITVVDTPRYAFVTVFPCWSWATIGRAVSMAMAKPMFWRVLRTGGVDADDLAVECQQRSTGVAGVDRCVGLQQVGEVLTVARVDRAIESPRRCPRSPSAHR